MTYFDCPKVAVILRAIELKERGLLKQKTYFDIAMDLRTWIIRHYIHFNDSEVKKIKNYGKYFPEIIKYPNKYILE